MKQLDMYTPLEGDSEPEIVSPDNGAAMSRQDRPSRGYRAAAGEAMPELGPERAGPAGTERKVIRPGGRKGGGRADGGGEFVLVGMDALVELNRALGGSGPALLMALAAIRSELVYRHPLRLTGAIGDRLGLSERVRRRAAAELQRAPDLFLVEGRTRARAGTVRPTSRLMGLAKVRPGSAG